MPKSSRNRIAYLLCRAEPVTADLMERFSLPETPVSRTVAAAHRRKLADVEGAFYETPAMRQEDWRGPLCARRSLLCRHAAHGFHGSICLSSTFHESTDDCVCARCGGPCPRYHLLACPAGLSLSEFASV